MSMNDKKITIMAERKEETLIKIDTDLLVGKMVLKTITHEWWTNREKMNQGIPNEDGHIYCHVFSGSSDQEVLDLFKKGLGR